ncbi:hypothetical protein BH24ACI2_BH24ACI2_11200 [soil metagenome]|nr:hypothetical protein [Acidobacteriota bacterium]
MFKIKLFLFVSLFSLSSFAVFSQTGDWRQYSFSMAGVKIKYPSDWRGEEKGYGSVLHVIFISPGVRDYDVTQNAGIGICTQPKGLVSTSSDSRSSCRQRDDHLSDYAKNKVVSEETVEINGLKIRKKISENKYRPDTTYIDALFTTKDRDVLISGAFPRRFNLEKYIPVFDRMLSTLQLLEKTTTLDYRNEKYGFSVSYPTSWRSCPLDDYYTKKEDILTLAPESTGCRRGNEITISAAPEFSSLVKLPDLKEILRKQNYSEISPSLELNELQTISGEKSEGKYLYRQRYFSVAKSETRNLLKISEMYDKEQEKFQQEAKEILATVKKLL